MPKFLDVFKMSHGNKPSFQKDSEFYKNHGKVSVAFEHI